MRSPNGRANCYYIRKSCATADRVGEKGLTIVPLRSISRAASPKCNSAVARGKKLWDKRADAAKGADVEREIAAHVRRSLRGARPERDVEATIERQRRAASRRARARRVQRRPDSWR